MDVVPSDFWLFTSSLLEIGAAFNNQNREMGAICGELDNAKLVVHDKVLMTSLMWGRVGDYRSYRVVRMV